MGDMFVCARKSWLLVVVIFFRGRGPLLLSPWGLGPGLLNVRSVSSAIGYRRAVFKYFE
jgi:hypothetical protein